MLFWRDMSVSRNVIFCGTHNIYRNFIEKAVILSQSLS